MYTDNKMVNFLSGPCISSSSFVGWWTWNFCSILPQVYFERYLFSLWEHLNDIMQVHLYLLSGTCGLTRSIQDQIWSLEVSCIALRINNALKSQSCFCYFKMQNPVTDLSRICNYRTLTSIHCGSLKTSPEKLNLKCKVGDSWEKVVIQCSHFDHLRLLPHWQWTLGWPCVQWPIFFLL